MVPSDQAAAGVLPVPQGRLELLPQVALQPGPVPLQERLAPLELLQVLPRGPPQAQLQGPRVVLQAPAGPCLPE
jgi:hypothetical protein